MIKLLKNLSKRSVLYACFCVLLVIIQVWLELTMPDYTQKLTETASAGTITMSVVYENGGMMLLCAVGSLLSAFACGYLAATIAADFARTLRGKLFEKVTGFSDTEFNRFSTPSLITRTTNDVVQMQMLIAMGLQVLIRAPIMAFWAVSKISNTSIEWTMAAIIAVAVIVVLCGSLVYVCYPVFKKTQLLTDGLNAAARENIAGVRVVRAFNAEAYQENKFDRVNEDITRAHLFTGRTMGLMNPVMTVSMNGLTLAIYWIGAVLINRAALYDRAVVMGNMIAFTQYAMQIVMSFMMLTAIFIILPRVMVSARRISEVLDTEETLEFSKEKAQLSSAGRIEFKNVSFAYHDAANSCLRSIDFTVEPGQTFAIIGATGSGKTSIVNLIPRFYDASEGSITINGADIRSMSREQLNSAVSIAPQKAILFSGDIKSNITYGSTEKIADDDLRISRALGIAQADFVSELSDGIHSSVAQGGSNFSGGQKQRLSIARAVFKDADIYIFDDSFSALDFRTDMMVRKALRQELSGKTVIIVAQRIGTIMNADKIMVLDDGAIAGIGTHKELLDSCPIYKEIALSQLSEEEL